MTTTGDLDTATAVLAALRADKAAANAAEIRMFQRAVDWALMHPPETIVQIATVDGTEDELTIAGPGAPLVAEFSIPELALALGMSTDAGKRYLGDAVETCYRLPRLWARVLSGEVPVWKARRVAQATLALPAVGAAFVDTHLAPVAERCSFAQLERTIDEARDRFDPEEAEARRVEQAEHRCLDLHLSNVSVTGLVRVEGTLDLADALALEAAVAGKAHALLETYPSLSLDVRRSMAAGQLGDGADGREVVIYTHHDTTSPDGLVGVENTRSFVTVEQLAEWCQSAGTRVTIRPVLDLTKNLHTDAYSPTPAQREQAVLTNPACVFPRCGKPSRGCDLDHIQEWPAGPTDSWNLAPLCRRHHRLKTHSGWTYEWTSPFGHTYRTR